jgi:hypothetical protein
MKSLATFIFSSVLLVIPAAAQHGGGSHGGGGHSSGGHSGGGSGFHGGGGSSVGGHGGYASGRGGYGGGGYSHARTVIVPYAYPAFGYGYGAPGYGNSYGPGDSGYSEPAPPGDSSMDYAQPAPPPDMNEQVPQPDNSSLQIYQAPSPTPEDQAMSEGRYYLIAYKDHSVYTALAYWMENGVLNYVTPQNAHNQVSLDLLDLDFTKQLNARRGHAFNLVNR